MTPTGSDRDAATISPDKDLRQSALPSAARTSAVHPDADLSCGVEAWPDLPAHIKGATAAGAFRPRLLVGTSMSCLLSRAPQGTLADPQRPRRGTEAAVFGQRCRELFALIFRVPVGGSGGGRDFA